MRWDEDAAAWRGGIRVKLPYTHSAKPDSPLFGVPDNLYLIGTMNTADRSIALLDHALRRRFTFEEVMPDSSVLAQSCRVIETEEGNIELDSMLDAMNQRIEYLLDRDHTIGHSYLMGVDTFDKLEHLFREKIVPLLQEYFHDDWEKIQLVLRDLRETFDAHGRHQLHSDAIVTHQVLTARSLFRFDDDTFEPRPVYQISEEFSIRSFQKIYRGE